MVNSLLRFVSLADKDKRSWYEEFLETCISCDKKYYLSEHHRVNSCPECLMHARDENFRN
jgi:predicted RNA-binding Zn-ribbon protein involved in translation (DUF1610 family)